MRALPRALVAIIITMALGGITSLPASAEAEDRCACDAQPDPTWRNIRAAIDEAPVVIVAGAVIEAGEVGLDRQYIVSVAGVVKGEVAERIVIEGDGEGRDGCRGSLGDPAGDLMFLRPRVGGSFAKQDCRWLDLDDLRVLEAQGLEQSDVVLGDGRPHAIAVGDFVDHDLAVVDETGQIVSAMSITPPPFAVAHCAGSSTVMVWFGLTETQIIDRVGEDIYDESLFDFEQEMERFGPRVAALDLETMTLGEPVRLAGDGISQVEGAIQTACVDQTLAVVAATYSPGSSPTVVSVDMERRDAFGFNWWALQGIVIDESGSHVGMSKRPADLLTRVHGHDFSVDIDAPTARLVGAESGVAGSWNSDGTVLAVLTRTIYGDTADDPGGRFVQFFSGENGVAIDALTEPLLLDGEVELDAVDIDWLDEETVIVERRARNFGWNGRDDAVVYELLDWNGRITDSFVLPSGGGLVVVDGVMYRGGSGGLERIDRSGEASLLIDTQPDTAESVFVAPLLELPDITIPAGPEIRPIVVRDPDPTLDNATALPQRSVDVMDTVESVPWPTTTLSSGSGELEQQVLTDIADSSDADGAVRIDESTGDGVDVDRGVMPLGVLLVVGGLAVLAGGAVVLSRRSRAD